MNSKSSTLNKKKRHCCIFYNEQAIITNTCVIEEFDEVEPGVWMIKIANVYTTTEFFLQHDNLEVLQKFQDNVNAELNRQQQIRQQMTEG